MTIMPRSIRARLNRFQEHEFELKQECQSLCDKISKDIQCTIVGETHTYVYKGSTPYVPDKISIIVGEMVHHLRTSLDYLVWELVVANTGKPPENEKNSSFPTVGAKKKQVCTTLEGVHPWAKARIKEMICLDFSSYGIADVLRSLYELDNICKHRQPLLNVLCAKPEIEYIEGSPYSSLYLDQTVATSSHGKLYTDKVLLKLIDSPKNLHCELDFGIYVGLDEALASDVDQEGKIRPTPLTRKGAMPDVLETLRRYQDVVHRIIRVLYSIRN